MLHDLTQLLSLVDSVRYLMYLEYNFLAILVYLFRLRSTWLFTFHGLLKIVTENMKLGQCLKYWTATASEHDTFIPKYPYAPLCSACYQSITSQLINSLPLNKSFQHNMDKYSLHSTYNMQNNCWF